MRTLPEVIAKADGIGLGFGQLVKQGAIQVISQPPAERILDALAYQLILAVRERGVKRLFLDGLVGFREAAYPERLPGFFAVLAEELRLLGVTAMLTEETRELFARGIEAPQVSATFDNILLFRQAEAGNELRPIVSVLKTRNSSNNRGLYPLDVTSQGIVIGPKLPSQP